MTRNRYYATVLPIAGILYVIALIAINGHHVATIGALVLAIIAMIGAFLPPPGKGEGRDRDRSARRARRTGA